VKFRIGFWDFFVGLPAGILIFMGTVLFSTLLSVKAKLPTWVPFVVLIAVTLFVGWLAGITRLRQGPTTALIAGLVAAGILIYLWLAARPGDEFNPLVIGPLGILTVLILCPAGGWLGAKLRKAL
jgi:CHASE2 domain-containing sensor protein